jgi:hypothetical protein
MPSETVPATIATPVTAAETPTPSPTPPDTTALAKRIDDLESQLATTRTDLARSERRREIERHLVEAGASDLEAAGALVMERIAAASDPDIADEVRALRRRKPGLFKRHSAPSSMVGRTQPEPPASPLDTAARDARTGSRSALLRYMRVRRA